MPVTENLRSPMGLILIMTLVKAKKDTGKEKKNLVED